jgi:TolA-binding protein
LALVNSGSGGGTAGGLNSLPERKQSTLWRNTTGIRFPKTSNIRQKGSSKKEEATSRTPMTDKDTRKRLKQIKKKISQLEKEIKKLTFRPCQNDSDLKQKDKDIKTLREKTYQLEKEHGRYILRAGNIKHTP